MLAPAMAITDNLPTTERGRRMPRDFRQRPEEQIVILIPAALLRKAQDLIAYCQYCDPESADFPFDILLDRVTGSDPVRTDYLLELPAKCPNCSCEVFEKTLIAPNSF